MGILSKLALRITCYHLEKGRAFFYWQSAISIDPRMTFTKKGITPHYVTTDKLAGLVSFCAYVRRQDVSARSNIILYWARRIYMEGIA